MTYYSREIKAPADMAEGLQNFVQMIINAAEAGDARQALLLAVDLHEDLCSSVNPYAEVLSGNPNYVSTDSAKSMMDAARKEGFQSGRVEARREAKAELQKILAAA